MENNNTRFERAMKSFQVANDEVYATTADMLESASETQHIAKEIALDNKKTLNIIRRAPTIIKDIHKKFEEETQLNSKDIAFLFGASSIQMLRWILLPKMDFNFSTISSDQRLSAQQGGMLEKKGILEELTKSGYTKEEIAQLLSSDHINNYTWQKLLIAPVPYDAMHGSKNIEISGIKSIGTELYGKNHHAATWGHDPLLGWVVGPLNITARMITFRDFQTYHVAQIGDTFQQRITYASSIGKMFSKCISAWQEDSKKLFISVAKQGLHFQSDKYTKLGLPLPLLKAETAQKLLLNGWNSNELERLFAKAAKNLSVAGAQFGLALTIDQLIKALHLLCYDDAIDGSISTYSYRTQRIICYSNALAEIANGVYVVASRDVGKIDIGGYINFAKNVFTNIKLRNQVETEFLEKELFKKIYGEEYYWEEIR